MKPELDSGLTRRAALRAIIGTGFAFTSNRALTQSAEGRARPLRIVVPAPAGGPADMLARSVAKQLSERFGTQAWVDNKPGGASIPAAMDVMRSAPDGTTLLLGLNTTHTQVPHLYAKPSFDPFRDFTPITQLYLSSSVLIAHPSVALGVYAGRQQVDVLFRDVLGKGPAMSDENGLVHGRLFNHLILQGIVHVADAGRTAQGRWRAFVQVAEFGKSAVWGEGPYEIEYRKDDAGRWLIRRLQFFRTYHTPFDEGWAKATSPKGGMRDAHPPSRPPSLDYEPYPSVFVPPFHYRHPITGQ